MMLLSAFVMVIALLAMSAMLARVPLLAKQSGRELGRPMLAEITPMLDGIDLALRHLATDFQPGLAPDTPAFDTAVGGLLEHLRSLESSRGFILEWKLVCDTPGQPATARAQLTLSDGELWVKVQTDRIRLKACP